MSEHENAFDQFVSTIQEDLLIHKKVFYLNHLLEKCVPDRLHISLQTVGLVDSFRETNGAAVNDIRHTLPLLTLNNDSITKVFLQLLLKPIRCVAFAHIFREDGVR
jgi:hypothetical protein